MPTHAATIRNSVADLVVDAHDSGSSNAAGKLRLTDGGSTVSEHDLSNPAFGAASSGSATANAIADAAATAEGDVDGWTSLDRDEATILSGKAGMLRAVTGVTSGAGGSLEISGDYASEFSAGDRLTVVDSSGNDGSYTVESASHSGGTTTITIPAGESLPDGTADGSLHVGDCGLVNTSVASGQTVEVTSFTYTAPE